MLNENHELSKLVVHSIRKDLDDPNEVFNCHALHAVANIGSRELAESLVQEIYNQFISKFFELIRSRSTFVQKKAGLCLLRLFRKYPEIIQVKEWAPDIVRIMDDNNLVLISYAGSREFSNVFDNGIGASESRCIQWMCNQSHNEAQFSIEI